MDKAWIESYPNSPDIPKGQPYSLKQEQGGWITQDSTNGNYDTIRVPAGTRDSINLGEKPDSLSCGCSVVGWFHTHPNKTWEGYSPDASPGDYATTRFYGVPGAIKTHAGNKYIYP